MRLSHWLLTLFALTAIASDFATAQPLTFVSSEATVDTTANAIYTNSVDPGMDASDTDADATTLMDVTSFDDMARSAASTSFSSGEAEARLTASFTGALISVVGGATATASGGIGLDEQALGDAIGDAIYQVTFSVPRTLGYQLDATLSGFGSGGGGFDGGAYYNLREVGGGVVFSEEVRRFEEDSVVFNMTDSLAAGDYTLTVGAGAVSSITEFDSSGEARLDVDFTMTFVPEPSAGLLATIGSGMFLLRRKLRLPLGS